MSECLAYTVLGTVVQPLRDVVLRILMNDLPVDQRYLEDILNWLLNTEEYQALPESCKYILELQSLTDSHPELQSLLTHQVIATRAAIYSTIQSVDHSFNPSEPHYLNSCYSVVVVQLIP